jgi:hypothetical protein
MIRTKTSKGTSATQKVTPKNQHGKKTGPGASYNMSTIIDEILSTNECEQIVNFIINKVFDKIDIPDLIKNQDKIEMESKLRSIINDSRNRMERLKNIADMDIAERISLENQLIAWNEDATGRLTESLSCIENRNLLEKSIAE